MSKQSACIEVVARGLWRVGTYALVCRPISRAYSYLPGGHVDVGESAADALQREFLEEAGLQIVVGPLLFVHEHRFVDARRAKKHEINLVFLVAHSAWPVDLSGKPVAIESCERKIEFDWIESQQYESCGLVPNQLIPWLRGESDFERCEWLSA